MQYAFVILLTLATNTGMGMYHSDSARRKQSSISIELGYSSSMFFENYTHKRLHLDNYKLSFFKIGYSRGRIFGFVDYKRYGEYNTTGSTIQNPYVVNPGFIWMRTYQIVDVGIGYSFILKKPKLHIQPAVLFSRRFDGGEYVYAKQNKGHLPFISYYSANYGYDSYGYGLSVDIRKRLYKGLFVAFETQYNHFFESKKVAYTTAEIEDFIASYKYNKNMLTFAIKLGYQIKFNKKN